MVGSPRYGVTAEDCELTAEDCELTAEDCELTAEDCGPTAIADRRLTADWETNCGLRTNCQLRNRPGAAANCLLAAVHGFATFSLWSHL